jgi:DNA ligase (NAD+)
MYMTDNRAYERSKAFLKGDFEPSIGKMHELTDLLQYHEWKYYVKNDPILSDTEYDRLYKMLEQWESRWPDQMRSDSPTQRIGSDLSSDFETVVHLSPMLSLANSYNLEDLDDFHRQVVKALPYEAGRVEYIVEPKLDGGTVVLNYENDKLVRAATRGNGTQGDDITRNIKVLKSVPLRAQFSDHGFSKVEIRGEAIIPIERFARINKERVEQDQSSFANPRNAATGGLRMKDPADTAKRGLELLVFQIAYVENNQGQRALSDLLSHEKSIGLLEELGFKIAPNGVHRTDTMQKLHAYCKKWEAQRSSYPYEIDGMVVKVNDLNQQAAIGATSHHPKWAIAYKFRAKQATTRLERVEFQVGKIGAITPVAKLQAVELAGVTVESASLHNEDFILERDLRIGDQVIVERAGDVIPYVLKALKDVRTGDEEKIQFPKNCPACDHPLQRIEGEAAWRCVNAQCSAQLLQKLIHFVSKNAMDIDGFGEKYIHIFHDLGWLKSVADIYRLDFTKLAQLERFGEKSARNLESAVQKSKQQPLYRLIHGLSIHHVGLKMSKTLAAQVNHILDLKEWSREDLTAVHEVGPIVAENVASFFHDASNIQILQELESLGVNLEQTQEDQPIEVNADSPLANKTILFTGSLSSMTRKEAQQKAEAAGAKTVSAVSGNLDILVAGEKAGSKLRKAQQQGGVQIVDEQKFIEWIQ